METVVFGGGCFWCTEAIFKMLNGVETVEPGYAGGKTENPDYWSVAGQNTGHAEVVKIEFDPSKVNFKDLLTVFFATHDATSVNKQGNDTGPEYRSMILYTTSKQKQAIEEFIEKLNESTESDEPIVTEVKPLDRFYLAEEYHRDFYAKNTNSGYCQVVINPKLQKVKKEFAKLLAQN